MEEQLKRIEAKVDNNAREITAIKDNHLCHIYEKLGRVSGQNYLIIALILAMFGAIIKFIM